jgi:pilus assembly protein CpaB
MKAARLVVLGIALAAGGIAAMLASGGEKKPEAAPAPVAQLDTVDVLVAKSDIGMGQSVGADSLQWQTWPRATAGTSFLRKDSRPRAVEEMSGAVARVPFAAGEPIRETKLIKANGSGFMAAILPTGMRAFSTDIPPETERSGFILPNDHVDVILSRRDREAEKRTGMEAHASETILTNVKVLAIDQAIEEKNGQKVVVGKTATLELTPRQSEILAVSRQRGTLSLILRSLTDVNDNHVEASDNEEMIVIYRGISKEAQKLGGSVR